MSDLNINNHLYHNLFGIWSSLLARPLINSTKMI